ncbi:hypothetical protein MC7420_4637 [Coleofasciculus chthonoplastes PCC 7420]|uniref:Heterocyst differentiation protein n=2 Tax=Coleofasciculus chthonoplastes TaxID=64178 RepID=B4VP39_9CYAN|nr:hypothetical protein MC7420_4637 [Coleofasciculus chthonoplastes PCC 7420]
MTYNMPTINAKREKTLDPEQFEQIIDAIRQGKYSWACVLLLRFAGHNPQYYIPYRTYNRLRKEHSSQKPQENLQSGDTSGNPGQPTRKSSCKIADLNHLEVVDHKTLSMKGGYNLQGLPAIESEDCIPDSVAPSDDWFSGVSSLFNRLTGLG